MKITVVRKEFASDRTFGDMYLNGKLFCNTLEPHAIDWSKEQKVAGKTAIPEGTYKVRLAWSTKWGRTVPWLRKVPHFRDIQIHVGNFPKDTRGCILVGDQDKDVLIGSRLVFDRLMLKLRNEAEIWIEVRNEAEAPEAPSDSPKGERTEEGTPIVGADRSPLQLPQGGENPMSERHTSIDLALLGTPCGVGQTHRSAPTDGGLVTCFL